MQNYEHIVKNLLESLNDDGKGKEGKKVILINYPPGIQARDLKRFGLEIGNTYTVSNYFEYELSDKANTFTVFLVEDRDVPTADSRCGILFSEEDVRFIEE